MYASKCLRLFFLLSSLQIVGSHQNHRFSQRYGGVAPLSDDLVQRIFAIPYQARYQGEFPRVRSITVIRGEQIIPNEDNADTGIEEVDRMPQELQEILHLPTTFFFYQQDGNWWARWLKDLSHLHSVDGDIIAINYDNQMFLEVGRLFVTESQKM